MRPQMGGEFIAQFLEQQVHHYQEWVAAQPPPPPAQRHIEWVADNPDDDLPF